MKKMIITKRVWICLLLCCLVCATASAQPVGDYVLHAAEVNTDALLQLTFGDQVAAAQRDTEREYPFYDLPNTNGPPFCGANDADWPFQLCLTIYKECVLGELHEEGIYQNVAGSGNAKCALMREDAIAQAEIMAEQLELGEYTLQSVTAYGKLDFTAGSYKVAFGQTLNGAPVYWAANTFNDMQGRISSNRIEMIIGDCGLYRLQGSWSNFEQKGTPKEAMSAEKAIAAYAQMGMEADEVELCYLLLPNGNSATATPSYRFQNQFIHAVTGVKLQ